MVLEQVMQEWLLRRELALLLPVEECVIQTYCQ